jgi:hypothetical protein
VQLFWLVASPTGRWVADHPCLHLGVLHEPTFRRLYISPVSWRLNLYAESTMRQEAEAFGTANRPDLFNMLDTYFRELRLGEVRRIPLPRTRVNNALRLLRRAYAAPSSYSSTPPTLRTLTASSCTVATAWLQRACLGLLTEVSSISSVSSHVSRKDSSLPSIAA